MEQMREVDRIMVPHLERDPPRPTTGPGSTAHRPKEDFPMHAVIVTPGQADSDRYAEVPDPVPAPGEVLVEVLAVGVDGTDDEIARGEYGEAPAGDDYLIIGHESLGRLTEPADGLVAGSLVAAIVRRPDPVPCLNCARDEWDMCLNGRYTERGIKGRHGYLAEYYTEAPKYLVSVPDALAKIGMLVEPTSIAAKALDQIWRIQARMAWEPRCAVVTGAGPVGLLAAAALRLRGLDVYVYDRAASGPKVDLVTALGATYLVADDHKLGHPLVGELGHIDIAIEATGYSPLAFDLADTVGTNGVVVLTGVSGGNREAQIAVDHLNLEMVLGNKVIVGTVNANRRHFEMAVAALEGIERRWPGWLERCVTRRVPHADYRAGLRRGAEDIKVVVEIHP